MKLRMLKPRLSPPSQPRGWKPDTVRGNRHQRGYGTEWDKLRLEIRDRANGLCEPHLAIGIVHVGEHCDHKTPKSQGGDDDPGNLQWVCRAFHDAKSRIESRGETVTDFDDLARQTSGGR